MCELHHMCYAPPRVDWCAAMAHRPAPGQRTRSQLKGTTMTSGHDILQDALREEPLTMIQAPDRWPRNASSDFAFSSPRRSTSKSMERSPDPAIVGGTVALG